MKRQMIYYYYYYYYYYLKFCWWPTAVTFWNPAGNCHCSPSYFVFFCFIKSREGLNYKLVTLKDSLTPVCFWDHLNIAFFHSMVARQWSSRHLFFLVFCTLQLSIAQCTSLLPNGNIVCRALSTKTNFFLPSHLHRSCSTVLEWRGTFILSGWAPPSGRLWHAHCFQCNVIQEQNL